MRPHTHLNWDNTVDLIVTLPSTYPVSATVPLLSLGPFLLDLDLLFYLRIITPSFLSRRNLSPSYIIYTWGLLSTRHFSLLLLNSLVEFRLEERGYTLVVFLRP